MHGGLLLRQRQGSALVFADFWTGSSSLTFACFAREAGRSACLAGCSGAEPHPTATQAITTATVRTAERYNNENAWATLNESATQSCSNFPRRLQGLEL